MRSLTAIVLIVLTLTLTATVACIGYRSNTTPSPIR
jgi:hypothetical protein